MPIAHVKTLKHTGLAKLIRPILDAAPCLNSAVTDCDTILFGDFGDIAAYSVAIIEFAHS